MSDTAISFQQAKGWTRLGLPGGFFIASITPVAWSIGLFDGTSDPILHSIVFGVSGIICFSLTPILIGWALQGFVVRRKAQEDAGDTSPARPGNGFSAGRPPKKA